MDALLAALPFCVALGLMAWRDWPASRALPLAWALVTALAAAYWGMAPGAAAAYSAHGALRALEVLAIIFGALLLLHTLRASGALEAMRRAFARVTPDPRLQAILLAWCFGALLEGMAGFGSPAALAAPMLASLGFPPLAAALAALLCNSAPVSFAAGGVPIDAALASLGARAAEHPELARSLGLRVALLHGAVGVFAPLVAAGVVARYFTEQASWRAALSAAPFALAAGAAYALGSVGAAWFLGPEFPAIAGALCALAWSLAAARAGWLVPRDACAFPPSASWPAAWGKAFRAPHGENGVPALWRAAAPYGAIVLLLLATRVPGSPLNAWLRDRAWVFEDFLGAPGLDYAMNWLYNPGILPFLAVAVAAQWWYRLPGGAAAGAWRDALKQAGGAAPALMAGVALAEVMRHSGGEAGDGMTAALAAAFAALPGVLYALASPLLGLGGALIAGSNTVSNILFAPLQQEAALSLGLSPDWIVALQIVGGGAGSMMNFNTVVAACAAVGLQGSEGRIMRWNAGPCVVYALLAGLIGLAVMRAGY